MTRGIPLGRKESQRLEFKGRDALKDRYGIGREVVGMLNAEQGGEIWVGLAEEEHRAVRVEAIQDAEVEARSLHDFLMDSIEPAPLSEEIEIQVEANAEGDQVLRIQAEGRRERQPYALLRRGWRYFGVRVGDRLRALTREEVLGAGHSGQEHEERLKQAIDQVMKEQEGLKQRSKQLLWFRLLPVPEGRLADLRRPELMKLLTDPTRTGSRRSGYSFAALYLFGQAKPRLKRIDGRTCLELGAEDHYFARVFRTGGVEFEAPLAGYSFVGPPSIPGYEMVLSPLKIAEFLTSIVRLLRGLFRTAELWEEAPGDQILAQLALFGLKGSYLVTESIRSVARLPELAPYPEPDFTLGRPLIVPRTEILENPDRLTFRMFQELFDAFGLSESDMPAEFDRKTRRLVLPE